MSISFSVCRFSICLLFSRQIDLCGCHEHDTTCKLQQCEAGNRVAFAAEAHGAG